MSIESLYILNVGDSHRKNYGQYFTHPEIAKFMVNWVLESGNNHIHDPSFGLGAFYHAAKKQCNLLFTATEIDEKIIDFFEKNNSSHFDFIERNDYLLSWGMKHGNIVCNPPYMRFQKFSNRHSVARLFRRNMNIHISGYTNISSAFLLKSLSELDGTGRLAYIMPIEFINTGYGAIVKHELTKDKHLFSIIKIECEKEAFSDATTSIGIILYDSRRYFNEVIFGSIQRLDELTHFFDKKNKTVSCKELKSDEKWLPHFQEKNTNK